MAGSDIALVIIGHLGRGESRSPHGKAVGPDGAGYACARGATVLNPTRVGLVAAVGSDYDFVPIRQLGVDLRGVQVRDGRSPRFRMVEHPDGRRSPRIDLGTARHAALSCFPPEYATARHVHIATAPPQQQHEWLGFLRGLTRPPTVSVDTFEAYAARANALCHTVCREADIVFMNEQERRLLAYHQPPAGQELITKLGPRGALYSAAAGTCLVPADPVHAVDTTGAGEILASVFLALRAAGQTPLPALRAAVRAATAKVGQFGVDHAQLRQELVLIRSETISHTLADRRAPERG